jgi:hypothetical protein
MLTRVRRTHAWEAYRFLALMALLSLSLPLSAQAAAVCGDLLVEGTEECDGGGNTPLCDANCTLPICGDGFLNPTVETCEWRILFSMS